MPSRSGDLGYNREHQHEKVEAIIRHFKLEDVKNALTEKGIHGMTVSEVRGFGRQKGHTECTGARNTRSISSQGQGRSGLLRWLVTTRNRHHLKTAQTGQIGDGKIFVNDLREIVRIRTGETAKTPYSRFRCRQARGCVPRC